MEFEEFFRKATTYGPYPYQARLAKAHRLPKLLIAPTGAGKTEAGASAVRGESPDDCS